MYATDVSFNLMNTWFPSLSDRLQGVYGIRFTLKVMVTVSANPFQQAVCALSWQPGVVGTDQEVFERSNNSASVTQLPHVRLDISETTMVSIEIPWVSTHDFMDIRNGANFSYGVVAFNTILPYRTLTTAAAPPYKVYVSLHDIELLGSYPVAVNAITPQSGLKTSIVSKQAPSRGVNQITMEAKSTGAVSGLLTKVADSVRVVTDAVTPFSPQLTMIGGATDWFLRHASRVAAIFGYSRPVIEKPPKKTHHSGNIGDIHVDLPLASYVCGNFQGNKIRVDSTLGNTDVDEMSFAFIKQKYGSIFVGDLTTADASGARLYVTNIRLTDFWFRANSSRPGGNINIPNGSGLTANSIQPSPLLFFGNMFRYWRGGLKFRFTFSKTKLHAGRLLVGFVPFNVLAPINIATTAPAVEVASGLTQPYSYSQVFDLRDSSVFEFEVPFIFQYLYAGTFDSIGGISMTVVDPLIANGESATTIDYLVEVCGMDDFEFAVSAPPTFTPAAPTGCVILQSGLSAVGKVPANAAEYTTGEIYDSAKQLMMQPSYVGYDVANASAVATTLPPWFYRPRWTMATPMSNASSNFLAFTKSGNVASCYAFYNGGTAWHAYTDFGDRVVMHVEQVANDFATAVAGNGYFADREACGTGVTRLYENSDSLHFVCPLYSRTPRIPYGSYVFTYSNRNWAPGSTQSNLTFASAIQYNLNVRNTSGAAARVVIGRAAADDARCAYWIGVPPVILWPAGLAQAPDSGQLY